MATPLSILIKDGLASWTRARGLWVLASVALVPPLLTGAWVWTHQHDVAADGITWEPGDPVLGDLVNITVSVSNPSDERAGAFSVTLRVGYHEDLLGRSRFRDSFNETQEVAGLAPGEETELTFSWNTSATGTSVDRTGSYVVEAQVDSGDVLPEVEELNNNWQDSIRVGLPDTVPGEKPELPAPTTDANATRQALEAELVSIELDPAAPFAEERPNVTVTVTNHGPGALTNASLFVQLLREVPSFRVVEGVAVAEQSTFTRELLETRTVSLGANETTNVTVRATQDLRVAPYLVEAFLDTSAAATDDQPANNYQNVPFRVDRRIEFQPPEEKATAKDFYRNVLEMLHLKLMIPLIALFFAAGILEDERERGNLAYLLTRPVSRASLPLARFLVGLIVAGAAMVVGLLLTYVLLLGLPQDAPGYFYWPLVFTFLALLIYGALFTLLGVATDRPYMWGLVYVIGFEALILLGRNVLVNGRPLLQDWVLYGSLNHWVQRAFNGWDPKIAFQWVPEGTTALIAFVGILGIAVASLVGAAYWMQKREFPDV